ncbi:hypothetical protein [Nocardia sp. BMG51109]|uniref:hypothetical protein n=1 Tax=Nocardia sp. BMG51109 TaxID=1056816 RepID=UPI000467BFB5|nr:hypothetical protein [Nocardia sp. BMG51109]
MAGRVEVDPDQLRDAAQLSEDLAKQIRDTAQRLESTLAGVESGANQPWGDDSMGKKFSEGDKGYKASRKNLQEGLGGIATTFQEIADGQRDAAAVMHGTDQVA